MRGFVATLFVTLVAAYVPLGASAKIIYEGLVLTSIDVKPVPGTERRVKFSGSIRGRADDDNATFLKDIIQVNDKDEDGKRMFEAEKISVAQAKKIINGASADGKGKPLFCIHGFNVQPGSHLKSLQSNAKKFDKDKFMLIPVIWPSAGGVINYGKDREIVPGAGNALKTLKRGIDSFPSKSLLAHSMGNFLLRHAADAKFKFDNIFMAAADVRHDLFHRDYIRSGDGDKRDGLRITRMLSRDMFDKPKGKIYVLTNGADYALLGSGLRNFVSRIGAVGNAQRRNWRGAWRTDESLIDDEIPKGCIENKSCNPLLPLLRKAAHGYHFDDFAVKFYQEKHF